MRLFTYAAIFSIAVAGAAAAHHGWGSYDASKPVTVTGPILTSSYENPHATITVREPIMSGRSHSHRHSA